MYLPKSFFARIGHLHSRTCTTWYMVGSRNIAWLTPHAADVREYVRYILVSSFLQDEDEEDYRFSFKVDDKEIFAVAPSSAALSDIVDVVLRLLAKARDVYELISRNVDLGEVSCNAPSLANLMEQCQNLKILTLQQIDLDEDHFRVLGALSRPGLEIELEDCQIAGATAAVMAETLGRNQGPTKLDNCRIDNLVLADGLRGNSRLKSFEPRFSSDHAKDSLQSLVLSKKIKALLTCILHIPLG
jgi:hypothetical protein